MTELSPATIYSLLREVRSVAMHASLTGSLKGGARILVEMYNRCLEALVEQGDARVKSLFPALLPESTKIDEVGAAAALLSRYVKPSGVGRNRDPYEGDEEDDDEA